MKLDDIIKRPPMPPRIKLKGGRAPGYVAEACNRFMQNIPEKMEPKVLQEYSKFLGAMTARSFFSCFRGHFFTQSWRPRPSGQTCTRQEGLKKLKMYKVQDTTAQGRFFYGKTIEAYGNCIALLAGVKLHSFNMKVTIPTIGECPVCGGKQECSCAELDALLDIGDKTFVVDWKSASGMSFQYIGKDDKWAYKKQLKLYMMSKELRDKVAGGVIVYVNKESGCEFAETPVPLPTGEDYDAWMSHCSHLHCCDDLETLPPKPEWATLKSMTPRKGDLAGKRIQVLEDVRCKFCDAKDACFGKKFKQRDNKTKDWYCG